MITGSKPSSIETVSIDAVKPDPQNARRHPERNIEAVKTSMARFSQRIPLVVNRTTKIIEAGNARWEAAKALGWTEIDVVWVDDDEATARAYAVADNRTSELGEWVKPVLADVLESLKAQGDLEAVGFNEKELHDVYLRMRWDELARLKPQMPTLTDQFVVPPFTILDQRAGYWQERTRKWREVIRNEEGRANLPGSVWGPSGRNSAMHRASGRLENKLDGTGSFTGSFDPVLCEVAYRWFCPPGGLILDPYAGGPVRGVIASALGRDYVGVDIRPEQVEANRKQGEALCPTHPPRWIVGDSRQVQTLAPGAYDLVFSCPPYYGLELYSNLADDINNAPDYGTYLEAYRLIVKEAVALLKDDRFAVFVVGNARDHAGPYFDIVGDTVRAFRDAGAAFYNEAIVIHPIGTLMWRVKAGFTGSRKLGKLHENCLVFCKGDPKRAAVACGPVEVNFPEAMLAALAADGDAAPSGVLDAPVEEVAS